ncbi:MAG: glycosyltransferase family 9 protein [Acidobacteria bacterium]|nr:glycosyltransferase family 9 protein [Acidobacteriota bacterium]
MQRIFVSHVASISQTVLALPALRALRHSLPNSHITIASSYAAADIVQLSHCANLVVPVSRSSEMTNPRASYRSLKSLSALRREHYDLTIELQRNAEGGFARWLAQIGSGKRHKKLLSQIREVLLRKSLQQKHTAQRYIEILAEIGAHPIDTEPRLYTDRAADERIEQRLEKSGMLSSGLLVGIHPGAGRNKDHWSAENFTTVAAKLIHTLDARVLIFAGPNERGLARVMAKQLPAKRALALESLSLPEMASAMARLSVFIGNQSGPAHLAAAVGTPVVAVSLRHISHTNDLLSRNHTLIRKETFEAITTDEVFEAACQLIKSNRAESLWAR